MSKDTAPLLPFSRLPELLERLYDSLASFLDAKLTLSRKEIWEEGHSPVRRGLGVAAAGVIALVGFMVLTASLVSFLATRLGNFPLSCVIIAAVYFVMGAAMAVVLTKKLTGQPLPKTRIELEKDKEWVKQHQYLEFRQELQNVMAETVGEIRPELAEEFEWKTYVQRHPGTCCCGALGLILGRSLRSQSPAVPAQPKSQAPESSIFPRMPDKVVSSVLAEALPLLAQR